MPPPLGSLCMLGTVNRMVVPVNRMVVVLLGTVNRMAVPVNRMVVLLGTFNRMVEHQISISLATRPVFGALIAWALRAYVV